jgi:hypothetical protein
LLDVLIHAFVECPSFLGFAYYLARESRLIAQQKRAGGLPPFDPSIAFVYWPVPVSAAVCGLPPPLSATLSVPLRVPVAVGLNFMLTVQFAPPAIELPHVFPDIRKSPGLVPAMENPVNVTVDVPALCTVIDFAALVVPTAMVPKFSEVGEREIAVPTPLRATV